MFYIYKLISLIFFPTFSPLLNELILREKIILNLYNFIFNYKNSIFTNVQKFICITIFLFIDKKSENKELDKINRRP